MELEKEIWNEAAIMELLGIERSQLDNLRAKHDLPAVNLARGIRVYWAEDLLKWVRNHRRKRVQTDETTS